MKLHVLQHVPFEGPAGIEVWAKNKNASLSRSLLFENPHLPDSNQFDLLVVMGGPMGIYDEQEFPWFVSEKKLIESAIHNGKSVLGICLGAQLIADVLGGPVSRNDQREIGWHEVKLTAKAKTSGFFKNFPERFDAFHWHGDTFQIPKCAMRTAQSEACANQAFEYDHRVLGLQFHLESSEKSIEQLIQNCGNEITDSPFIQSLGQIRAGYSKLQETNLLMNQILDCFSNACNAASQ